MKVKERFGAYTLFALIVVSLGGFLFGYFTAIISGALIFLAPALKLTLVQEGMAVSILLIGALLGAMGGGDLADRLGRKKVLLLSSLFFIAGAVLLYLASDYKMVLLGRAVSGLGVGLASVATPLYLAEIAPPHYRGRFVALFQLMITLGILAAYLLSLALAEAEAWRAMFGFGAIPALLQFVGLFFVSDTPAWLFKTGRADEARRVLARIRQDRDWKGHVGEMRTVAEPKQRLRWKALLKPPLSRVIFLGVALSLFQQITGINTVIYFAPKIMQTVGLNSTSGALLATVGIGIINVIATIISVWLLDHAGRRRLLLIGITGMVVCLATLVSVFYTQTLFVDVISVISLMGYVAFFAMSLGPVVWVLLSEIFPLKIRSKAVGAAIFINWLANYVVSLTFLDLIHYLGGGGTFLIYTALSVLALIFVYRFIPETKGKSLEEIEAQLGAGKL